MIDNKLMIEMLALLPACDEWPTDFYRFEVFGKGVYFKKDFTGDKYCDWKLSKSYL